VFSWFIKRSLYFSFDSFGNGKYITQSVCQIEWEKRCLKTTGAVEQEKHAFGIAINVIVVRIYIDSRWESHKALKRSIGCFQATLIINNREQSVKWTVKISNKK